MQTMLTAPQGPFPIWEYRPDGTRLMLGRAASVPEGITALSKLIRDWQDSKPSQPHRKRSVIKDDAFTVSLYYSDGKLRAIVSLDPVPVPRDASHPGDILVDRPGVK